ncbi:TTL domain-containing protein [Taphrina deformans PYCC 5710]|uniref:TTL domain-containing protein n=1 Tax=Taphrina deformans (strain PYCC 5710 / ATCC 11124 / CBS 356.35 / IMI 108563 / JCM 9778 / NBRC 8474) TaxID=1097556 RepID=R4X9B2_TAPDE|nr:TTL domain-containing protein [Taphrina deformans PYCC 5710]|eukprot:CCG82280.1 TTL domain-containing protein [Taphrina deformans PYCC 5710]
MKIFYKPSSYTDGVVRSTFSRVFSGYELVNDPAVADLQLADYEDLDFQTSLDNPSRWICAYSIRKALIRKQFLNQTVLQYVAKHPDSILVQAVPQTWDLEVDYVEFLDDALDESFELRGELEQNEARAIEERKWFILKPSMGERGAGLRLFSTIDELTSIFEDNEPPEENGSEGDEICSEDGSINGGSRHGAASHGIMTSDMRNFVVQEYLSKPLLLPVLQNRKFHIRAYVLCIGSLEVFVHKNMLVLSSAQSYDSPTLETDDLYKHLTNTCYQKQDDASSHAKTVHAYWTLDDPSFEKEQIWEQIGRITGQVFAAASAQSINFQTIPNAFEVFGVDYLVDENHTVNLLEVNAYPDFAQTGEQLHYIVDEVIAETIELIAMYMDRTRVLSCTGKAEDYKGFTACFSRGLLR